MVKKSMTEAEAIEVIRKAMEYSISAIKELDKAKHKIDMVGRAGEYYSNVENCGREIAACMLAINALKEIQQYRAIGSIDDLERLRYLRKRYEDESHNYCGEYGTSECGAKAQLEWLKMYEEIGTVEEIRKVVRFLSIDNDSSIIEDLQLMNKYQLIGTVEECREARERQRAKKPTLYGDFEDGKLLCPNCEEDVMDLAECGFDCCPYCGQKLDWTDAP